MALRLSPQQPRQYTSSRQLIAGDDFNNVVAQLNSMEDSITAGAGGTQAKAYQLGSAVNIVTVVATANDSVKLPKGVPGLEVTIQNADAADSLQVFTYGVGTINGTDGAATGVALANGAAAKYKCLKVASNGAETWVRFVSA